MFTWIHTLSDRALGLVRKLEWLDEPRVGIAA